MRSYSFYTITDEYKDLTVEAYLKQVLQYSGRRIQKLTRQKGFLLNRKPSFLLKKLKPGDVLQVIIAGSESGGAKPEQGDAEILYEDEFILVANKPPRQLVHPAGQTMGGTLANFLAFHLRQRNLPGNPHAVHRLDRDTSGCVLFAKDSRSQYIMSQQLSAGQLSRKYLALVSGIVTPESGTINAPVGPHPSLPNRRVICEQGEPAVTHYRLVRTFSDASLLELALETGRTHQIRVHLAHLGHPIIGDGMYGTRVSWMPRQALHANSISFEHIETKAKLTVNAPLPADFINAVRRCEVTV